MAVSSVTFAGQSQNASGSAAIAASEALHQHQETTASPVRLGAYSKNDAPATQRPPSLSDDQVHAAAQTIGEALGIINQGLRVRIDESTNRVITQIINRDTNEIIRQIPSEELLDVAKRLRELVGVLFDVEI